MVVNEVDYDNIQVGDKILLTGEGWIVKHIDPTITRTVTMVENPGTTLQMVHFTPEVRAVPGLGWYIYSDMPEWAVSKAE